MTPPLRAILAAVVACVRAVRAAWAVLTLPYTRGLGLTSTPRWLLALGAAVFLAALSAWVVFILPAYWD